MKSVFKLSGFIVIMAVFSACFSPWAGDPGVVTITFGDGGQENHGNAARSPVTREEIPTLTHIITLYGNGTPVIARLVGAGTISITVLQGNWNIRVRAESPEPEQTLRALGFGQVRVVAGQSTSAAVYMVSATEVTNHAQLAAAISSARTDGLEKIIVLTEDMNASAQFTVGTNRHISLVSDSDVAIRRGSGFNPEVEMFVMQGNATLRLGRYGTTGSVYVQGATGAVLPPLDPTPPEDPTNQLPPTEGLVITPAGVLTGIGGATGVTDIVIPHDVVSIQSGALRNTRLNSVVIPNSVDSIGSEAFRWNSLTSVTIGNSVTSIGQSAFANNRLTSVTIPDSVTSIGMMAFANNNLTSVTIPDRVTRIEQSVFQNNRLESVTIHNSVTSIGATAFANNLLTNVTIPDSVTSLFGFNSNRLTSVTIPDSVIHLGGFSRNRLTSVTIPDSVIYLGVGAFQNNYLESVIIGNSVPNIDWDAFRNNNLTNVTIPDSVTSIGMMAFANNSLTNVTIGNSVESIGSGAFMDNRLTNVTIPDSVTSIRMMAFANNNLTSVTIGTGVTIENDSSMGTNGAAFLHYYNVVYQQQGGTFVFENGSWRRQ